MSQPPKGQRTGCIDFYVWFVDSNTYKLFFMGRDGLEPPRHRSNWVTASRDTITHNAPKNGKDRNCAYKSHYNCLIYSQGSPLHCSTFPYKKSLSSFQTRKAYKFRNYNFFTQYFIDLSDKVDRDRGTNNNMLTMIKYLT